MNCKLSVCQKVVEQKCKQHFSKTVKEQNNLFLCYQRKKVHVSPSCGGFAALVLGSRTVVSVVRSPPSCVKLKLQREDCHVCAAKKQAVYLDNDKQPRQYNFLN